MPQFQRRLPIGAEPTDRGTVHFRVWAPRCRRLTLDFENSGRRATSSLELQAEGDGYFSAEAEVGAGTLYRFRPDGGRDRYPDPASRFQPAGPHGPSQVVDPAFPWTDRDWAGAALEGQVAYELHVGTFTPEGTWAAATRELAELADAGITLIELMPVADFPGRFGWGYDGVNLFAPTRLYGTPDDFRRFVDRAHAVGIGVILDVVYNHFGPDGNYLGQFADAYTTDRYDNEWGDALNFDGPDAGPVREYFLANARYWIDEFHLDGLRLDATQQIFDASPRHIIDEIAEEIRRAAAGRVTILVGENEPQDARLFRSLDALWNDDFHHTAIVALTGRDEAYYSDYRGAPQELVSAVRHGFLYQGQFYRWQKKRRGTPARGIAPARFVHFLENHDQLANSARGERVHQHTSPGRLRAMTAVLLLGPQTPMLFQGQEFAASTPFLYFADHKPELAKQVKRGRMAFLSQFPSVALPEVREAVADPADPETFTRCKLDLDERRRHAPMYDLHRDLLRLRRTDPVFRAQGAHGFDGAVLGPAAFVLRFFADDDMDRLLLVNLGGPLHLEVVPEPLLAPPAAACWAVCWSSEDPRYGGLGLPPVETPERNWSLPGECAVVLVPQRDAPARR